ncbi:class I SAM-dependent methyltransferase [Novosphingobium olei]|uniref:Class I SAM-dependent methyltransferase n=1 Tax=Novosphingobium olei TaxID=2728851 RepID=A0A7Y0GAF2_9SPHN|nr:class I SAM-dependent methyltransferase [Novosphingobium olei]NML95196.1 class I SAM-dependent methyltransferase [Novosphingobium olei]
MKPISMLAVLGALALAHSAAAAPKKAAKADPVAAAIADSHRSDANRKLDENRMPDKVLAFAGFKAGSAVADWGAGGGYYTELLADVVGPKGRVYAINSPAFAKPEVWAAITQAHPNVLSLLAPAQAQVLAPGSLDGIFAHLEYHDLYFVSEKYQHPALDVPAVLKNWFAAVRPGGTVVIIDHVGPAGDPRAVVDKYHRIDPARVRADLEGAGFVFEGSSDVLHRTDDPHDVGVFDPAVRGKTDRFILKFRRP